MGRPVFLRGYSVITIDFKIWNSSRDGVLNYLRYIPFINFCGTRGPYWILFIWFNLWEKRRRGGPNIAKMANMEPRLTLKTVLTVGLVASLYRSTLENIIFLGVFLSFWPGVEAGQPPCWLEPVEVKTCIRDQVSLSECGSTENINDQLTFVFFLSSGGIAWCICLWCMKLFLGP